MWRKKGKTFLNDKANSKRVWITWESQRRNHTLSKALGAKLFQFDIKLNRLLRYPLALLKTLATFVKQRPDLIFAQNPSIVLAFFAANYGKLFGIPVVIDAHNAGVFPLNGTKLWATKLGEYIFRISTFTIVTNIALAEYVMRKGGKPFILPDPVPEFQDQPKMNGLKGKFNVVFICSWANDEPYIEVMKAAKMLEKEVYIYITGNSKGKEKEFEALIPDNVIRTDFLKEEDYIALLNSCDLVIDLTTRENCLVCGAYEAVAAGKPLIVSDTKVLREFFYKGVLYTDNTSKDLAGKIDDVIRSRDELSKEIKELKIEIIEEWEKKRTMLNKILKDVEKGKLKQKNIL